MAIGSLKVKVSVVWWLRFYLWGVMTTVYLTHQQPDWEKVARVIQRAVRIKFI